MLTSLKRFVQTFWLVERYIRLHIAVSRTLYFKVPLVGRALSLAYDRALLIGYGIDLMSSSVAVRSK